MVKHFLSIQDLTTIELLTIIDSGLIMAKTKNMHHTSPMFDNKFVGIYFPCPSTRTRTSFVIGAQKLGAKIIQYSKNDLQISTGETIQDTIKVLSSYLNTVVIRTNASHQEFIEMSQQHDLAIINAMSEKEHPTQIIADLITIKEHFHALQHLHILYLGEGNNTAASLALAISKIPQMQLTLMTPANYGLKQEILTQVQHNSTLSGAVVTQYHDMAQLPKNVDVVYTTRWQTMGVKRSDANWLTAFQPFQVNQAVMAHAKKPETIFMHDLPAIRGQDTTNEVLDAPYSVAFRQASHKLTAAMAVLNYCMATASSLGSV